MGAYGRDQICFRSLCLSLEGPPALPDPGPQQGGRRGSRKGPVDLSHTQFQAPSSFLPKALGHRPCAVVSRPESDASGPSLLPALPRPAEVWHWHFKRSLERPCLTQGLGKMVGPRQADLSTFLVAVRPQSTGHLRAQPSPCPPLPPPQLPGLNLV